MRDFYFIKVRKALIVIGIVIGSIMLLTGSVVGLLHLKSVQTYIISKVTNKLSKEWQTDVHIAQFHYRPLSHLVVDSIYLSDQQKDTLAYIEQIDLRFDPLALGDMQLEIEQLIVKKPYINIQNRSDSSLNCQFILDHFQADGSGEFPLQVHVGNLQLQQTRLRYNNILADQLDLALTLPIFSKDSLDIHIETMHVRAQMDQLDATFEANLHGGLDSIFADSIHLSFKGDKLFDGNVAIYHPIHLDSLYVHANCRHLYFDEVLFQDLLNQLDIKGIALPLPLTNLKHIHYVGDIDGRLEDMQLHGAFTTALGTMRVNGLMQIDTTLQGANFKGHVSTNGFQIGKLFNHKDLGNIAFDAHIDGSIDSTQFTHCIAEATIKKVDYLGYTYHNIHLDGEWNINEINGTLSIQDDNIQLNINGLADWDQDDTRIDLEIQLNDFSPAALHLTEKNPNLRLSANTYISLYTSGTPQEMLDNLNGYLIIDSLKLANNDQNCAIEQIKLLIDSETKDQIPYHQVRLQSDLVTANLSGTFTYAALPTIAQHITHKYLPLLVEKPQVKYPKNTNLDFYAYFRQLDQLTNTLDLGIDIPSYPTIKGHLHGQDVQIQAFVPSIKTNKTQINDITFALHNTNDEKLNLSLYMLTHLPQDNPTAVKLGDIKTTFNVSVENNYVDLNILLGNTDSVRNEGNINISSHITRYLDQPKLDIQIKPTHIILNDSAWTISPTELTYTHATNSLDVHHLRLETEYQSIKANGRASKEKSDSINVQLNNINLNYLLSYTEANKVISIQGPVTGTATIYSVFSDIMLEAKANISKGGINGVYLGDVAAEARLDKEKNSIIIEGDITDSTNHIVANVLGTVIPAQKSWELDIACDSIDINFIDFWTQGIVKDPIGRAFGRVRVGGKKRDVWVTGAALAKNALITIPQIGVTYGFTDSVYLDSTAIRFPDIDVYDQYGNPGVFAGAVYHNNFKDIRFDLRAQANNLLVMDLPADQQAFFYGKVFGTGDVHIYGDEKDCKIDVNARTEANTKFYLNINSASKATQSNFIHFVQPDTASYGLLSLLQPKASAPSTTTQSKLRLSLQGEVTPQAEINIRLGAEDGIKGRGEGNLKLIYESPSENVQMQGSYTLQSGLFSFSLGNIVRRNFTIREGSRITWDNDPLAPTLDITGYYHTTASLRDLFGSESAQIATNRTSVPVNCVLNMSDQLFNPILKFAIELPQSDESVQSQVNSMINTEEMLMRQIIYLLVFNRFYTPEYLQNTQNVGLNETYSLLSSTLTGQINSWLSKLTDVFTMGFNFRTDGEGETASQEYEANFQIHPINQLIINGNFGYRYNDLSNRPFFGDLDVEYLLTKNGKVRVKAYTHTVDKYSLRQANTVQGVGFVFKHDFNWKKRKKTDTTPLPLRKDNEGITKKNQKSKASTNSQ